MFTAVGLPIQHRDVVAWDVASNTTAFLSGTPLQPRGSGFPSISGDGRFVRSRRPSHLTGPQRTGGPWTFVADRSNGQIRMISARRRTRRTTRRSPVTPRRWRTRSAGRAASSTRRRWRTSSSRVRAHAIDVAYGPSPGFTSPFSTETISILANGAQGGMHMMPALSGNGQWVAWISNAGNALLASDDQELQYQHAFTRRRDPGLAVDSVNFGTIAANTNSTLTTTVRNTGRTSISVDSITATPGQFTIQGEDRASEACSCRLERRAPSTCDMRRRTTTARPTASSRSRSSGRTRCRRPTR